MDSVQTTSREPASSDLFDDAVMGKMRQRIVRRVSAVHSLTEDSRNELHLQLAFKVRELRDQHREIERLIAVRRQLIDTLASVQTLHSEHSVDMFHHISADDAVTATQIATEQTKDIPVKSHVLCNLFSFLYRFALCCLMGLRRQEAQVQRIRYYEVMRHERGGTIHISVGMDTEALLSTKQPSIAMPRVFGNLSGATYIFQPKKILPYSQLSPHHWMRRLAGI